MTTDIVSYQSILTANFLAIVSSSSVLAFFGEFPWPQPVNHQLVIDK